MEKDLVEYIVKSLVEFPEEVRVGVVEVEDARVVELHVAESDLGKVIGKQGRIAKAIRTLMSATRSLQKERDEKRAVLEILE